MAAYWQPARAPSAGDAVPHPGLCAAAQPHPCARTGLFVYHSRYTAHLLIALVICADFRPVCYNVVTNYNLRFLFTSSLSPLFSTFVDACLVIPSNSLILKGGIGGSEMKSGVQRQPHAVQTHTHANWIFLVFPDTVGALTSLCYW